MCTQASVPARAAGPALNPSLQTQGSDSGVGVGLARGAMRTPTHHSCESSPFGISFLLLSRSSHHVVCCCPPLVSTITSTADALCTVQCLAESEQGAAAAGVLSLPSQCATLASTSQEPLSSVDHAVKGIVTARPDVPGNQSFSVLTLK